ncbi:hypothetical protein [Paraburkholderia hospita]|uniref:hypothetical protein n=1 Tax=Paraburkholderia hospita TaxID=169430 RepID=UPI001F5FFB3A|nr:hypothetical protein [Paraburkholderia hospita]
MAALYEHSIFTQGTSLNIDSFDQCGVELGNMLAPRIAPQTLESANGTVLAHDSSSNTLIRRCRRLRETPS